MILNDIVHSLRREREERLASVAAGEVCGRIAHATMADRYAARARSAFTLGEPGAT